ncbi:hypothetical protein ACO0K3_03045 [Undibacterium sp. Rencai35W]|uniref:hypothetical protein n=1 Tax=Undibacterium sp. Rencai35W TaxID=3413046 RepID=UPI003BF15C7B
MTFNNKRKGRHSTSCTTPYKIYVLRQPIIINTILSSYAKKVGLGCVPELSSHSLCRDIATSTYRAAPISKTLNGKVAGVMMALFKCYIEEAGQFEENAEGTLLRRKQS